MSDLAITAFLAGAAFFASASALAFLRASLAAYENILNIAIK